MFRSASEVEKRIHSKLFRKFWRSRGTKEPAYITVHWDSSIVHCGEGGTGGKAKAPNENGRDLVENAHSGI